MKNKLLKTGVMLLLMVPCALGLKAEKLTIIHEDWSRAQQLAKQQNKLVLIDFYTTWCVPCKIFSANLKENKALQTALAQHYILLKYDAEKDEKYNLTKKLHINSYPTFAVMSPNIEFVDKLFGNSLENQVATMRFKDFAKEAWNKAQRGEIPTAYNKSLSNEYPAFYVKYIQRDKDYIRQGRKKLQSDIDDFWKQTKDWSSETSFAILKYFGGNAEVNEFVIQNKSVLIEKFGEQNIESIFGRIVSAMFSNALKKTDKKLFQEATDFAKEHLNERNTKLYQETYNIRFAKATSDCTTYEELISLQLGKAVLEKNKDLINRYCWDIYESVCNSSAILNDAETNMSKIVEEKRSYAFLDTYACILFKNKKYSQAQKYMKEAIDLAKEEGQSATASKKILDEINKKISQ